MIRETPDEDFDIRQACASFKKQTKVLSWRQDTAVIDQFSGPFFEM